MKFTIETMKDGICEISNDMNTIIVKPVYSMNPENPYDKDWQVIYGTRVTQYHTRESACTAAIRLLDYNNVIDVVGFLEHLSTIGFDDIDNYAATLHNIIEYGLRHECLVQNQLVDWLVQIIAGISVADVVIFVNDYWLNADYLKIKESQYFVLNEWVAASDVWDNAVARVDCGHKHGLSRGYRIEVADMTGTKWLPVDCINNNDTLSSYFNNDEHVDFYKANNYRPTGRISFMGYFKLNEDDEYELID